ncbi:IS21 family transposase (plasmid) [Leifsonia sp. ZF2019]|uniref:IS21 family transposase n=1 Tax=Leifsonia sp. ZF2019 TaxID=2781978 RepID=UPI001CC14DBA|nr:IS21 family transposase [Leifsonia sp. ZF2019]UAJ81787.1 IS21 family transposase [Leifsonia sp. ZF2019]
MGSRVDLYAEIRRAARVEELSVNALAKRFRVHRRTIRQALESSVPPPRKTPVRASPKIGPFKNTIDGMLRANLTAPKKQRQTVTRIHARLLDEFGAALSYAAVRDYCAKRKPEIAAEVGRLPDVFVPQEHAPAAEAEVDFGEVWVVLAGVKTKCHMFTFRLSHSGKAVHRVYSTQSQEAFLEGHIDAFEEIGGVPTLHIKYDNLTAAVKTVIYGTDRRRVENDRWVLFRSHYGFDPFYCLPGVEGAHEKGGVEGEVGRFRRTWLSPMPEVDTLAELNEQIRRWDLRDEDRRINQRRSTVGADFAAERPLLWPLPAERFDPGLVLQPRVDRSSLITVRMAKYSVPVRLIGRKVRVSLRAFEVVVFDGHTEVARHERVVAKGGESIVLDHYLEVLRKKPGAFPGSVALAQARQSGWFSTAHEAFWQESRKANGDAAGTRELIEVLLLHRHMRAADVIAGIRAALTVGAVSADVVAVEARLHAGGSVSGRHLVEQRAGREQRVVSLTQRRLTDPAAVIAGLPPDKRPMPTVTAYDELLKRRPVFTDPTVTEREGTTNT